MNTCGRSVFERRAQVGANRVCAWHQVCLSNRVRQLGAGMAASRVCIPYFSWRLVGPALLTHCGVLLACVSLKLSSGGVDCGYGAAVSSHGLSCKRACALQRCVAVAVIALCCRELGPSLAVTWIYMQCIPLALCCLCFTHTWSKAASAAVW